MKCENMFCVYFNGGECILEEITLDLNGSCRECVYVEIEEKILEDRRKYYRKRD